MQRLGVDFGRPADACNQGKIPVLANAGQMLVAGNLSNAGDGDPVRHEASSFVRRKRKATCNIAVGADHTLSFSAAMRKIA